MTTMLDAMPEANVLYSVTGAVLIGLVIWVATVLKTSKEAWARSPATLLQPEPLPLEEEPKKEQVDADENEIASASEADASEEKQPDPDSVETKDDTTVAAKDDALPSEKKDVTDVLADVRSAEAKLDADSTARATPVAKKSEGKVATAPTKEDDAKKSDA